MAERTARLGSMFYQDSDGRYRRASAGDVIQVHPDYVERFDRLNVLQGAGSGPTGTVLDGALKLKPVTEDELITETMIEEKPAPKRRGRPPKKVAEE